MWILLSALVAPSMAQDGFDHTHAELAQFLDGAVSASGVQYGVLAQRRPLLDAYLQKVSGATTSDFSRSQKLALYINAYNAYTLRTILDEMPVQSIMNIDGGKVWETRRFSVAGESLTLNQIENERVRRLGDGRIHAAVNCASRGCPPLPRQPITPNGIDGQLTRLAKVWAQTNAYSIQGEQVQLNRIFDWYSSDFANTPAERDIPGVEGKEEAALWFLANLLPEAEATKLTSGGLTPAWQEYDWGLNKR